MIGLKNFVKNAQKTASNREIQKTLWVTSDLIRNKTADKITNKSKTSVAPKQRVGFDAEKFIERPKEIYISPAKHEKIVDEVKLIQKNHNNWLYLETNKTRKSMWKTSRCHWF